MEQHERTFWSRTEQASSGCRLWTAGKFRHGYGATRWQGRNVAAHRVAWILTNGPVPQGMMVLHHCDVRACVNPDHLFLGDHADNAADAVAKGRMPRGVEHPVAKLTEAQVHEIRQRVDQGELAVSVAERFGVSPTTVRSITRRETWGWLAENPRRYTVTESRMLTISDIAELCGVKKATVDHWRLRSVLPPPDAMEGRSPVWSQETVDRWRSLRWDENGQVVRAGRWDFVKEDV